MRNTPDLVARVQRHLRALSVDLGRSAGEVGVEGAAVLELEGSVAMYCGKESPLTQASGNLNPGELNAIDGFFRRRSSAWEAILTPLSDPRAFDTCVRLGGKYMGWEQLMARQTTNSPETRLDSSIEIVEVGPELLDLWAEVGARGFHGNEATNAHRLPSIIMSRLSHTRCYLATVAGQPVAASSVSVFNGIAFLGGMATLPEFRNLGIQAAMLGIRLRDVEPDADIAVLGAALGGGSFRNAERAGFTTLYSALSICISPSE